MIRLSEMKVSNSEFRIPKVRNNPDGVVISSSRTEVKFIERKREWIVFFGTLLLDL